MTPPQPKTSARLRRAAEAEQRRLERRRGKLATTRQTLAEELAAIDQELGALDERLGILAELAGAGLKERATTAPEADDISSNGAGLLRGTAIRETATRLLAARPEGQAPIHYRRWYGLLQEAGYRVAGKDPLAVFLTQISRSPVVKRSTEAGIYWLDREVPERLRARLAALQNELREATSGSPDEPADLARIRGERDKLLGEVGRVERALDEATRVLDASAAREIAAATRGRN